MLLALLLQQTFDTNTGVSVAILIAVLGTAVTLSRMFTRVENKLDNLKNVPARLRHIENHLLTQEEDLNNVFGAIRATDDPAKLERFTRRSHFKPLELEE